MRHMLILVLVGSMLAGCGSVSVVGYPREDGKWVVMRTMTDPHAISPTPQRNWTELCDRKVVIPAKAERPDADDFVNCLRQGEEQFTTTTGYISGLVSPLLYSGAVVGGAYYIGKGLSQSGGTTYNNTSSESGAGAAASSSSSAVSSQQQGYAPSHRGGYPR